MLIDIITTPEGFERGLEYVATRTVRCRLRVAKGDLNNETLHNCKVQRQR